MSDTNGTKFINKQTIAYLQSKRGEHVEKKIENLKARLDLEYNYLNELISTNRLDLSVRINEVSKTQQEMGQYLTMKNHELETLLWSEIEELKSQLRLGKIVAVSLAVGGLALWAMAKLLT